VRVHHPVNEPAAGAQLVVGDARGERGGEIGRIEAGEVVRDASPQAVPETYVGEHRLGQVLASRLDREHVDQEVAEIENRRAARAQRLGENVVLLLRAADPRDAVEQQRVVVAGRQPGELGSWAVEQDGIEPADLTVDVSVHTSQRIHRRPACASTGDERLNSWPGRAIADRGVGQPGCVPSPGHLANSETGCRPGNVAAAIIARPVRR
jgi:hypothetical protein